MAEEEGAASAAATDQIEESEAAKKSQKLLLQYEKVTSILPEPTATIDPENGLGDQPAPA